ncbi:MAG: tryptophan synthase subunit alpha [Saprospiraceae bacterium]
MNRINKLFQEKGKDILNIYFTAGYPNLNDTEVIIQELAKAGADLIEVGMPYSDPLADGETIQQSSSIALGNGMHLDLLFEQIKNARKHTDIPIILMGYVNQFMQYGAEKFIAKCVEVGVDGLILPDLPLFEYERDYKALFEENNITISFLITPLTEEYRIKKVDELTRGFVYMVSSNATTGGQVSATNAKHEYFKRINEMKLKNPRLIGFGISDNKSFMDACNFSNGAIIGSAFIRALNKGKDDLSSTISEFVSRIKN